MNPESPCRSIVTPMPKLSERLYDLRLLVVSCWYLPILLPFFQSSSPSPPSHISSVAVLHILLHHIHACCPASLPPCLSGRCLQRWPCLLSPLSRISTAPPLASSCVSVAVRITLSFIVLCTSTPFLSNLSYRIFSYLWVILYYTAFSTLIRTNFLTLRSDILTTIVFLFCHGSSLSLWCFCSAPICRVFLHLPSLWSALICLLPSALSVTICLLHLWSAQLWFICSCSDLLDPMCLDQLAQICSVFCSSRPSNFS